MRALTDRADTVTSMETPTYVVIHEDDQTRRGHLASVTGASGPFTYAEALDELEQLAEEQDEQPALLRFRARIVAFNHAARIEEARRLTNPWDIELPDGAA